ncbi:hypothetical protein V1264_007176 [Littorina saxatilis]|uniref:DIS3-like exonuclease 2 n=2 Tax=Littorina saxatilis TaxID=31220 RepID=A0AAN9AUB6_9CAEN
MATADVTGQVPLDSASPAADSSSVSASSTFTSQVMDVNSVRQAILGAEGDLTLTGTADSVSALPASKPKKKKKRPKSAKTSSGSETAQADSLPGQQAEGEADVTLSASLGSMAISGADASGVDSSTSQAQKPKKKRKKKKNKETMDASAGQVVEMADSTEGGEGKGHSKEGEESAQALSQLPENIRRLHEKLLQNRNMTEEQRQQQQQHMQQQREEKQHHKQQQHQHHNRQHQGQGRQNTPRDQGQAGQTTPHGQGQAGQNTPRHQGQAGQNTPRGQGGQNTSHSGRKHHQKKNVFEPYWPMEQVSEGLKRGTLVEGRIRINPKNYEDAYVPFPDGTMDIYIAGMSDRNRALNGDTVAVLIQDRGNWRVFKEELDNYEKINTPPRPENSAKESEEEEEKDAPDVVVEEEMEVELDGDGKTVSSTEVKKPPDSVSTPQATPTSQGSSTPNSGARPKDDKSQKGGGTPGSSCKQRRFMSVKDVMDQGSSVAKKLFSEKGAGPGEEGGEPGGEGSGVNFDRFMQRTGKVVAILEKKHSRAAGGHLRPMLDVNHSFATFAPTDSRVPRMMIPTNDLPKGFKERPEDFTKVLFIARITDWNESSKLPKGQLARSLGEAGQVEPETEALLIENDVDCSEFSDEVLECLPQDLPWTIPAKELEWRRDLRKECIFTIDPSTARDLDDALHCTYLGDGVYEVGVHIADVSYFVKEYTELDKVASERATSVYLVQKVIPMLPRLLCEQLCSLNPDEDRLSFSVIWKMTENGEILEEWFGRTVIRSCVKLSYEHAQGFIEQPDREWTREELPPISEGYTVEDIKSRVLNMDKIAKAMRQARFDGGALRLDQVKIQYMLNQETGLPNGYFVYQQRDSNKLVEEFMLLANMAVAHKIRSCHKDKAVLRRHPPPQSRMVDELKELCASLGYPMKTDSAKEIQLSLARYTGEDELSMARLQVLVVLCSRPMQNAKYFCCGVLADEKLYAHYALNVPLYTHFTSPIRRYPDVLVHRTLAAALGYNDVTQRSSGELQKIAEKCNDKKTNAKMCSEKSNEIYFSIFVKEAGPLEEKGMVMAVLDKSFDVYFLALGVVKRVYCERLPLESFTYHKEGKRPELTMVWKADDGCPRLVKQKISIFSLVSCLLQSDSEPLRWSATMRRPLDGDPTIVA